jgi:hypothetical protein
MIHVDLNSPAGAQKIQEIMERRTTELMQMATIEFHRQVTISTPVDTGRARWGWNITVNAPSTTVPPPGIYPMPTIDQHIENPIDSITVTDAIYITNNVPYIKRLNAGYSKNHPARFVEQAAARVQAAVSKLIKKIK